MREFGYKIIPDNAYLRAKDGAGINYGFWIQQKGKEYYFKTGTKFELYSELFFGELAKLLNMPSVSYDLAKYKDLKGVISKSFNPNKRKVLNAFDLLENYLTFMKENIDIFSESPWISNIYNLENLWWAISYYYKNHPKKKEIVKRLMNQLTKQFMLQLLTFNSDLNYGNVLLITGKSPYLAPSFDYGRCNLVEFTSVDHTYNLISNHSIIAKGPQRNIQIIQEFFNMSDESHIREFAKYLNILIQIDFKEIIRKIELITQYTVSDDIKEYLIGDYQEKLIQIQKILFENQEYQRIKKIV